MMENRWFGLFRLISSFLLLFFPWIVWGEWSLSVSHSKLQPGSLAQVLIQRQPPLAPGETSLGDHLLLDWGGKETPFFQETSGVLHALISTPYREEKQEKSQTLKLIDKKTKQTLQEVSLQIEPSRFPSETLKVDPHLVAPPKKFLKRILKEKEMIRKAYQTAEKHSHELLWKGGFRWPIQSKITSPFGVQRRYNGSLVSFHTGLDLRAKVGTPVHVAASGRVLLAHSFFYAGKMVLVDHGQGLFTFYAHLSEFSVKPGMFVKAGTVLGKSGATGRITGPHLHWQAILRGETINPEGLLTLRDP